MSWKYNPFTMEFDYFEEGTVGDKNTLFEIDENEDTMPANINIEDMELNASDDLILKTSPTAAYSDVYCELDSNYDIMPRETT